MAAMTQVEPANLLGEAGSSLAETCSRYGCCYSCSSQAAAGCVRILTLEVELRLLALAAVPRDLQGQFWRVEVVAPSEHCRELPAGVACCATPSSLPAFSAGPCSRPYLKGPVCRCASGWQAPRAPLLHRSPVWGSLAATLTMPVACQESMAF